MRRFLVGMGAALAVIVVSVAGVSAHTPVWKASQITSLKSALRRRGAAPARQAMWRRSMG